MSALAPADQERVIRDGMKYVRGIAWKTRRHNPHIELEHLIANGYLGLVKAARRYDTNRGTFGPFAVLSIRSAIADGIRRDDPRGRHGRRYWAQIDEARYRYAAREHHYPTSLELARELGWTPQQLHASQQKALRGNPIQLDANDDTNIMLDPNSHIEAAIMTRCARDYIIREMRALPDRERLIFALHFWEDMTQVDIAAVIGVTPSRVNQIIHAACSQLRARIPDYIREAA